MLYRVLVEAYEMLDETTKRLEMTTILMDLFRETPPELMDKVVYMTQGKLHPDFSGVELGVGEKVGIKAISQAAGHPEKDVEEYWRRTGDLGFAAEQALLKKKQQSLFTSPLSVEGVYHSLDTIARSEGDRSVDVKTKILAQLLHDASPVEGRYIMRTVNGKLRLGVADMTILDALSSAYSTKDDRTKLEAAYNRCSDLGEVARAVVNGLSHVVKIHMRLGTPLRPMLAERVASLEDLLEKMSFDCVLEYKYDGLRVQAHIGSGEVKLFSRHMENLTMQFPDVVNALGESLSVKEAIIEGECVPMAPNGSMRPFQAISQRRGRKHGLAKAQIDVPVAFFAFDCLYKDGKELLDTPYLDRRKELAGCLKETEKVFISRSIGCTSLEDASLFFEESINAGCEGIMAKSTGADSVYKAGARGWQWIKYKMDYGAEMIDTVDLVAVGAFAGKGRRAGAYGALLMAAYNPNEDVFETVCKLGTGFDDETLFSLRDRFTENDGKHPRAKSSMKADFWLVPEKVMEVAGAEITLSPIHTCAMDSIRKNSGLAVRFPRFTGRWREDRGPEDATTSDEILSMYKTQMKKSE